MEIIRFVRPVVEGECVAEKVARNDRNNLGLGLGRIARRSRTLRDGVLACGKAAGLRRQGEDAVRAGFPSDAKVVVWIPTVPMYPWHLYPTAFYCGGV